MSCIRKLMISHWSLTCWRTVIKIYALYINGNHIKIEDLLTYPDLKMMKISKKWANPFLGIIWTENFNTLKKLSWIIKINKFLGTGSMQSENLFIVLQKFQNGGSIIDIIIKVWPFFSVVLIFWLRIWFYDWYF